MKVLDRGHDYLLHSVDGGEPVRLTFVKRNDPAEKYPENTSAYPGTQIQEVLRALIDRAQYVNQQFPCDETALSIVFLREILYLMEARHARRHGSNLAYDSHMDTQDFCLECGHVTCFCPEQEPVPNKT